MLIEKNDFSITTKEKNKMAKNQQLYRVLNLYFTNGQTRSIYNNNLTQWEHAKQCWRWMDNLKAPAPLRIAALFHNIYHVVVPGSIVPYDQNDHHEYIGARYLKDMGYPARVYEPVRLNIKAKRYLVSTFSGYYEEMSTASQLRLENQGGLMKVDEIEEFRENSYFESAVAVRVCADQSYTFPIHDLNQEDFRKIIRNSRRCTRKFP